MRHPPERPARRQALRHGVRACLAAAASIGLARAAATAAGDPIVVRIGHAAPARGRLAALGEASERAARMAVDALNAQRHALAGRPLRFELVAQDDGADPARAVQAAHQLVARGVLAVVGHLGSTTTLAAAGVYAAAGVPQIAPAASSPRLARSGEAPVYRMVPDDLQVGERLGRHAASALGTRRAAVIDDRSAFGRALAAGFERGVSAESTAGAQVVSHHFTHRDATDFIAVLTAVAAARPDTVFFGGPDRLAGPLLRQMRELGITARLIGGDALCNPALAALADGAIDDGQVLCAEVGGQDERTSAAALRFAADFRARHGVEPSAYAAHAYDAVMLVALALLQSGSAEPGRLRAQLAQLQNVQGLTGRIAFDAQGGRIGATLTLFTYRRDAADASIRRVPVATLR